MMTPSPSWKSSQASQPSCLLGLSLLHWRVSRSPMMSMMPFLLVGNRPLVLLPMNIFCWVNWLPGLSRPLRVAASNCMSFIFVCFNSFLYTWIVLLPVCSTRNDMPKSEHERYQNPNRTGGRDSPWGPGHHWSWQCWGGPVCRPTLSLLCWLWLLFCLGLFCATAIWTLCQPSLDNWLGSFWTSLCSTFLLKSSCASQGGSKVVIWFCSP